MKQPPIFSLSEYPVQNSRAKAKNGIDLLQLLPRCLQELRLGWRSHAGSHGHAWWWLLHFRLFLLGGLLRGGWRLLLRSFRTTQWSLIQEVRKPPAMRSSIQKKVAYRLIRCPPKKPETLEATASRIIKIWNEDITQSFRGDMSARAISRRSLS